MRLFSVFRKSMREQLRSVWLLILTVSIAPVFVLVYWFITGGGTTTYKVMVINNDQAERNSASQQITENIQTLSYANGQPILKVIMSSNRAEAERGLKNREAAALLIFPEDFTSTLAAVKEHGSDASTQLTVVGDLTYPYYPLVSIMALTAVDDYVKAELGQNSPVLLEEVPLGASNARTEFEMYVPALLILSVVMMIFQTSMTVAREVEGGTLRRLQMTNMTAFDLLGGISLTQVLISVIAVMATFLTAVLLGFHSQGSLCLAIFVGVLTSFSIIGVGLIIACLARTVSEAFIYANFPLIFLMFFTGAAFPIPALPLFTVGSRTIGLFDVLPPTHAVVALNKVLTLGAGFGEILYEVAALTSLSLLYFGIGVWLFQRTRLHKSS